MDHNTLQRNGVEFPFKLSSAIEHTIKIEAEEVGPLTMIEVMDCVPDANFILQYT